MRFIPWDEDLAQEVTNNFKALETSTTTKNTTVGHVAEALVQKYYGQPINTNFNKPDEGWDLLVNGAKTDVKSQANVIYFGAKTCTWVVSCYHGLRADVYLFVSTDPVNKKIALIGWLTPEEIMEKGTYYRSGDTIPGYPYPCNGACYRVKASDLWPID